MRCSAVEYGAQAKERNQRISSRGGNGDDYFRVSTYIVLSTTTLFDLGRSMAVILPGSFCADRKGGMSDEHT
jgi:hypothetical protein